MAMPWSKAHQSLRGNQVVNQHLQAYHGSARFPEVRGNHLPFPATKNNQRLASYFFNGC
jgi:hypothetical protein